ncbi:MAG: reverse transcriptase family protein [Saprospiraceae bacterium]
MSDQPRSRQELYEKIRETSKEEFILNEMKRLGFWNTEGGLPKESETLIKKSGELNRELQDLMKKKRAWQNKEKLLKEMRAKRMEDAKKRREETKERREKVRQEKAEKWAEKKEKDIIYLGEEYSKGLNKKDNDVEKLKALGLPVYNDVKELADDMKITLGQLRFLCYSRKVSTDTHYKRFSIPKKTGGERIISAPMMYLKNAQHWTLENILYKLSTHDKAHGFVPGRSIITNAEKHLGKEAIINIDLKDFFPSLTFRRVKGLFRAMGYSEQISVILTLLCTEPNVDEVEMDGETYYVSKGERHLPQGAPTSPAITNLICNKLDRRMEGLANSFAFTYSRYADDMTFSKDEINDSTFKKIMGGIKMIISEENFTIHPDKIQIMRKGSRREVTGIVINEKLSVPRKKLKNFRAVLHKIEKTGTLDGIDWGTGHPLNTIYGFANFVRMVDHEKGEKLMTKIKSLMENESIKKSADTITSHYENKKQEKLAALKAKNNPATEEEIIDSENEEINNTDWWSIW